ncbi:MULTISPECIES: hypothetical protein [unclassified Streptomyces]|uniref:hypothetical protein n=1 Tax=unclassified Streptomyces TaxID=2593676 RepID=UPI002E2B1BE6|nr:hypothetical protein [Streptomyces sp. NBC_00228]
MATKTMHRRDEAVLLLARGFSSDEAGRQIGVNGSTVRRWRADLEFELQIQETRRAALGEAVAALEAAAREAVDVLTRTMKDPEVPATVRVRAALGILSALPGFATHAELEQRIAALEIATEGRDRQ